MAMRIVVLGAAFAAGGADPGCRHGPAAFHRQEFRRWRKALRQPARWAGSVVQQPARLQRWPQGVAAVAAGNRRLMCRVRRIRGGGRIPFVLGGDHSCAIGTWSGIAAGRGPLGLLWIDAHLDAHTPETSETRRIHGMPLAALLGEGDPRLLALPDGRAAVDPRYCAVVGVRSFEAGEPVRLRRLGVRYYTRLDIRRRGLGNVLAEAWRHVAAAPGGFGVSVDLDVLDPLLAPGVSVPERRGLDPRRLSLLLRQQPGKQRLRGLEVVELNPQRDRGRRTRRLLPALMSALLASR
jgi:arginase